MFTDPREMVNSTETLFTNRSKEYVKIEDHSTSGETSFSSIDERQFADIIEGTKNTDFFKVK